MKRLQRGILIALEGIDGSGKTTLAQLIKDRLCQSGFSVLLTREPGATVLGKEIRTILQKTDYPLAPITECLLFAADRAQHIHDVVKPALSRSEIVISDRMADSSRAYQGFGRNNDKQRLESVIEWAMQGLKPDVVFYLELDIQTAWQRIIARNQSITRFEAESKTFYTNIIKGFETIFAGRDDVIRLDAKLDKDVLSRRAFEVLIEHLKMKGLVSL